MPAATPLHHRLWHALEANDLEHLNAALAEGANPNSAAGGWVPLGKALRRCHPELALALIQAGADVWGRDARESLVSLAAANEALLPALRAMLERGATATTEALSKAARAHASASIELLLAHGAPALGPREQGDYAPLCWWILQDQTPVPDALLDATFQSPALEREAGQIAEQCAKNRNMQVLHTIQHAANFPDEALHQLLVSTLHAGWREGLDHILSHRMVPAQLPQSVSTCALVAAYDTTLRRNKPFPGDILGRLVDYGFGLDQMTWRFVDQAHPERGTLRPEPVFLRLVERSTKPGRRKLLSRLLAMGAPLHCRRGTDADPGDGGGVVHLLLALGDPSNALWLMGKAAARDWERPKDPGLICTLLARTVNQDTPAWIHKFVAKGADLTHPDSQGRGAWELLLNQIDTHITFGTVRPRPQSEHVRLVAEALVQAGLPLSQIDSQGTSAKDRMQALNLDAAWVSSLEAWMLSDATPDPAGQAPRRRL